MVLKNECGLLLWCQHILSNRPCFYNITHPGFLAGVMDKTSLRVTPHCDCVTSICLMHWVNCGFQLSSLDSTVEPTLSKAPHYSHASIPHSTPLMFYAIHNVNTLHHLSSPLQSYNFVPRGLYTSLFSTAFGKFQITITSFDLSSRFMRTM